MHPTDLAYISVLAWPERFSHRDRVEALVRAGGLDPFDAGQAARRPTPAVVLSCDALIRDDILGVLHRLGVLAVGPLRSRIKAYPVADRPRALTRFAGSPPAGFAVQTRDGGAWTFRREDIRLVVLGRVRTAGQTIRHKPTPEMPRASLSRYAVGTALTRMMQDPEPGGWGMHTTRNARAVETIDFHLLFNGHPRLVRLAGASTHIRPNSENPGRPCLFAGRTCVKELGAMLPGVRIDTDFETFSPPPDVVGKADRAGQGGSRLNPVAFDFYSAWAALADMKVRGW